MRHLLFMLFVLQSFTSSATNFYVDASTTSTTQNGSAANPWKTIAQVNNNMNLFNPGDFISFKRGGVYPGQLNVQRSGAATKPITFNAYGTGAAPLFTGTGGTIWYLLYVDRPYITFDGLAVTDPTLSLTDRSSIAKIQRAFYLDVNANNVIVKKCTVNLAGVAIFLEGPNNTIDSCTVENLRMVVNTPGGYDDYGANPIMMTSSNNKITNNKFLDCWAPSYDYTYDGGAIEIYGNNVNNNFIGYNTMVNNCGLIEIASPGSGTVSGTVFAYNKLINNGSIFFIHNQTTNVTNLQFYNNVIIETVVQRVYDNYICAMNSTSSASGIVVMKNNIFWLSTGIDVARSSQFTGSQMVHEDNIYRLGTNSVLNFNQNASEMVTAATNIFTNTSAADPASWNLSPVATGPAIDFGQNVGLARDFAGNPVPSVPNAGLFETGVTQGPALAVNATSGSILCNGGTTSVTVTATGGTAPYSGTGTFTVSAGTYTYNVTDAAGNTASKSLTVTQPSVLNMSLSAGTITTSGGTTTVTAIASGGAGNFTYKLNNGSYQSSANFSGVVAGTHTITLKDVNGCTLSKTVTITQPANNIAVNASPGTIACFGGTTPVTVTASGGQAPYSGTGTFTVSAGTYSYTVTDAVGATKTTSITVAQPVAVGATLSASPILSQGGFTTIVVSASGGTTPYTYKLTSGVYQSSNNFLNIFAGDYIVYIKDARGCTITKNITITQPAASSLAVSASAGAIACNGGSTTVNVSATGGVAPYTGTGSFTRQAGSNSFSVTDAVGTTRTTTINISQPNAISTTLEASNITTFGGVTSITVSASGGTGSYQYKRNNGAYTSNSVLTNVPAGTHTVTVMDANGCTTAKNITITQPASGGTFVASSSAGTITCNGGTTTVNVSATGGQSPYTGTGSFTVSAGTYTYTVRDANGTTRTTSITVAQPQAINATVTAGTVSTGGTTSASVSATGGTAPYTYKLNNGTYQSSATFNGVGAGNHSITVRDTRGCTSVKTFTVSQQGFQIKLVSKSDNSCRWTWDGRITVGATGGTAPYYYQINAYGYGSTSTFINLGPGTYTLYAMDATGRISSMSVQILASTAVCSGRSSTPEVTSKQTIVPETNFSAEVYPNPATDYFQLRVKNPADEKSTVTVMNVQGKIVERATVTGSQALRLGTHLSAGIYIVHVANGSEVRNFKVIKTN